MTNTNDWRLKASDLHIETNRSEKALRVLGESMKKAGASIAESFTKTLVPTEVFEAYADRERARQSMPMGGEVDRYIEWAFNNPDAVKVLVESAIRHDPDDQGNHKKTFVGTHDKRGA